MTNLGGRNMLLIICCFSIWLFHRAIRAIDDFIYSLLYSEDFRLLLIPFLVYGFIMAIFLFGFFISCELIMFIGVLLFISVCVWSYMVNRSKYKEKVNVKYNKINISRKE